MSAWSIITAHTNCMAVQNQELVWPTLQRKTELLEYPGVSLLPREHHLLSLVKKVSRSKLRVQEIKKSFCTDAELFLKEMDVYISQVKALV